MGSVVVGLYQRAEAITDSEVKQVVDILKVLLCYSNNSWPSVLARVLGGPEAVQRELVTLLEYLRMK
jgi:hypothetical protein